MKSAKDYYSSHMVPFEKFNNIGYTAIEVLEFLGGLPWDDIALGFVHSLRPSSIRVVHVGECIKCDARVWRVTVYVDINNRIQSIEQEVEVGLPEGIEHGDTLHNALLDLPPNRTTYIIGDDVAEMLEESLIDYIKKNKEN